MSADSSSNSEPFDLVKFKELVELMEQFGLTEVSLQNGDEKWRLRRGYPAETIGIPAGQALAPIQPALTGAAPPAAAEPTPADDDKYVAITSPTVGTYYSAPSPDDPNFVEVGAVVAPDTTVCIVEAMKVFNQIPAEVSGVIVEILVSNGDSVEFGQQLFKVRPQ